MLFKNCCLTLMGRIVKKKHPLRHLFVCWCHQRFFPFQCTITISMFFKYPTCFYHIAPVSQILSQCVYWTKIDSQVSNFLCVWTKTLMSYDNIWYHNVDRSGHPRKTRKLINIFQISGRPQLGEFKAIHSTNIFVFGSPKSRSSSFQTVNRGYNPPLDDNFQPI